MSGRQRRSSSSRRSSKRRQRQRKDTVDEAFLAEVFRRVDGDGSGEIDQKELQAALSNGTWVPFNEQTVRLMIGMFDRDGSGTIDLQEFGALWKYLSEWQKKFQKYDTDHSGNIDKEELALALSCFGYRLSDKCYGKLMRQFDRTSTGKMNFDDFVQLCVVLQTLTTQFRTKDKERIGQISISYEDFLMMTADVILQMNRG